jgi:malonyl-CoA/methylmalonyl-CoA synthetase
VQVEKSVEALLLYLACLRAGLIFVPLNTAYQKAELENFISDAEPAVLVCSSGAFAWLSQCAFSAGVSYVFTLNDDRTGSLLERAAQFPDHQQPCYCEKDDPAAIIYTSGTTGRSKGAVLSHGNLLDNARVLQSYWDWQGPQKTFEQGGDVLIHALPIFHVHGLFVAVHGALLNGSKMIWLARFDPQSVIGQMPRATLFMGVPTYYVRLLAQADWGREDARTMRLFVSGSAPLLKQTFTDWQTRSGKTIVERYGMSETVMLTSNPCRPTDGERRAATVGRALPGVRLRIRDGSGGLAAPGEVGEIEVQGSSVFRAYWRNPDRQALDFTADGYFRTGDLGKLDADGYVTISGRSKDLIISGGLNVYPVEVEGYINALPGVAESAVVAQSDPDFGEVGLALVVPRAGQSISADEILLHLKNTLANFKVPKRCLLVADLPRNAMGKVQKKLLRERYTGGGKNT